ncbi:uncharacterized protein LOC143684060 isoform X2 [Tamandua tetradactyla]|uniref:uncharacterized protein LOC143684060 isoform X2 n=1 Tax=Tamandua tetradactyla TaxID=48850 RepID=UPI0040544506
MKNIYGTMNQTRVLWHGRQASFPAEPPWPARHQESNPGPLSWQARCLPAEPPWPTHHIFLSNAIRGHSGRRVPQERTFPAMKIV